MRLDWSLVSDSCWSLAIEVAAIVDDASTGADTDPVDELAAREDDPKRRRKANRLAVSCQKMAMSAARIRVRTERIKSRRLLVCRVAEALAGGPFS